MVTLTYLSITKTRILFSLPNNNTSPSLPPRSNRKPQVRRIKPATPPPQIQPPAQPPSVAEIERAIGAGIFRDRDTNRDSEQSKTLFDSILSNSIGKTEGSVEKKLRETGEWVLDRTEGASRSSGDKILKAMFLWILPMWIFAFFVATGVIKLPFSTPLLDDLIM